MSSDQELIRQAGFDGLRTAQQWNERNTPVDRMREMADSGHDRALQQAMQNPTLDNIAALRKAEVTVAYANAHLDTSVGQRQVKMALDGKTPSGGLRTSTQIANSELPSFRTTVGSKISEAVNRMGRIAAGIVSAPLDITNGIIDNMDQYGLAEAYAKDGAFPEAALIEYGAVLGTYTTEQNLTFGNASSFAYSEFNDWANKFDISPELRKELDPTNVTRQLERENMASLDIGEIRNPITTDLLNQARQATNGMQLETNAKSDGVPTGSRDLTVKEGPEHSPMGIA